MADFGISAAGAYLPLLRIDRKSIGQALQSVGLGGRSKGSRTVANWDEDPVTMAVEAARSLACPTPPESIVFASTSGPFFERSHAALVIEALAFPDGCRAHDVAGSRRCAVTALLNAMLSKRSTIVTASERRPAKPGNPAHGSWGDGSAAVEVTEGGFVTLLGYASQSRDFLDFYRSQDHPEAYAAEERFVRESAIRDIIVPTINQALENAGISGTDISHVAVHEPLPRCWKAISKACGIAVHNHCDTVANAAGDLGAAHPIFGLGLALDEAKAGDRILLVGFGSGCDALVLQVEAELDRTKSAKAALQHGKLTTDYVRFLNLTNAIELDWGVRSEIEQKAQSTVLARYGRDIIGFVGGRDSKGNIQFPKSSIPVNPELNEPEIMEDVRLADVDAKILSVTADRLNFTPDPPFDFGLVQFDNGARVLMEMVDRPPNGFSVGDSVRMFLRIKSRNKRLGSRTYFWKAAPIERPVLEAE